MRPIICCLLILAVSGCLFGLELPLQIAWDSHNELSYLHSQSEKEYNWREFYRIGIGLDSLAVGAFRASLLLQSRADFISNPVEISEFSLAYGIGKATLFAASLPHGWGRPNSLNPLARIYEAQDDFRYQATRFNRLGVAYQGFELSSGGNQLNQAMLALAWEGEITEKGLSYRLAQEGRARDSHWNTPVSITSAAIRLRQPQLELNCEAALSHFFEYDNTRSHNSHYALAAARFTPCKNLALFACAEYKENEASGFISRFGEGSMSASFGKLCLSPGLRFDQMADDSYSTLYLSADWCFQPQQRIGLLYRLQNPDDPVQILGLQASLNYRL